MVRTPFTDASSSSSGGDGGGESDTDDTDNTASSADSTRRGRRRARETIEEIDDENRDSTTPTESSAGGGSAAGSGGPTQGPDPDGDGGSESDRVPAPDPSDPSTAPSATPAPDAGDDAGASVTTGDNETSAPDAMDPSTAPSATSAASAGEDAGSTIVSRSNADDETTVEATTQPEQGSESASEAVEGYPTQVPSIAEPSESGTAAAADIVKSADFDADISEAATSGGFSRLPLPTVNLEEPAANFRELVESRNTGFTTVTADLPGTGTVPVGLRLDMSEEDSGTDTTADQFTEGALQAFNPAAAAQDLENIAEAADNPGVYLQNPAASVETGTAAGREASKDLAAAARENPAGTAGALTVGLAGIGAGAATAARGSGSLRAAVKAEVDPRVGPFGTTLETRGLRAARDRLSNLPTPGDERGQANLIPSGRQRGDADDTVTLDADDLDTEGFDPDAPARGVDRAAGRPQDTGDVDDFTRRRNQRQQRTDEDLTPYGDDAARQAVKGTDYSWQEDASSSSLDVASDGLDTTSLAAGSLFGSNALSEAGQPTTVDNGSVLSIDTGGSPTTFADPADTGAPTGSTTGTLPLADDLTTLSGTTTELDVGADDVTETTTTTDSTPVVAGGLPTLDTESDLVSDPGTDQPVGQDTPQDTGTDTPQDPTGRDPPFNDPPEQDQRFDAGRDEPNDPRDLDVAVLDDTDGQRDDRRRDDTRYSDLFRNPTITPAEALDFDPFDDDEG